jgi:hypothetical protein
MTTDTEELITAAEKEVTRILAILEADTSMVIDRVVIREMDVTVVGDLRPQWIRSVVIEMKRLPGTRWRME